MAARAMHQRNKLQTLSCINWHEKKGAVDKTGRLANEANTLKAKKHKVKNVPKAKTQGPNSTSKSPVLNEPQENT